MPGVRRWSRLSTRTLSTTALMSRLLRPTSRWVAKSASTPLKMTLPSSTRPEGRRTLSASPRATPSDSVSGTAARTQTSLRSTTVTMGWPALTTSPWRAARTETVPEMGATTWV